MVFGVRRRGPPLTRPPERPASPEGRTHDAAAAVAEILPAVQTVDSPGNGSPGSFGLYAGRLECLWRHR
jgi:hypothetical protein